MIARLTGTLAAKSLDTIILDVGGVGYELFVPLSVMESLANLGDRATLSVHTLVREDAITLYGFATSADRLLFQRLMTVSGVGPKLALQALSVYTGAELQTALVTSDERSLMRISGIGKKTAQRMLLELSEKVALMDLGGGADSAPVGSSRVVSDLVLGLLDLGFTRKQADDAAIKLKGRAEEGVAVEVLLREALRLLRGRTVD